MAELCQISCFNQRHILTHYVSVFHILVYKTIGILNISLTKGVFVLLGPWPSALYVGSQLSVPGFLGPLNFIVIISRNRLVWPEWSIKILHKNTKHGINRIILRVLLVQGTFSTKPFVNSGSGLVAVASITTTDIKVFMFRGLSHDLIKVWNWDILHTCTIEKLHKCYK